MFKSMTKKKLTNKLPPLKQADLGFKELLDTALKEFTITEVTAETRVEELHPSSFPYCPLRHVMDELVTGTLYERQMDMTMNFYVSIGTVVHEILQEYLGKAHKLSPLLKKHKVYLIGDWKCRNPDCGHIHTFTKYRKCKKCGSDTKYEELAIWYGKKIVGHTDGLFYCGGYYFIIDYKTSGIFAIDNYKRTGNGLPYKHNVDQIKTYVAVVEENRDIEIYGYGLIYIARDGIAKNASCWGQVPEKEKVDIRKTLTNYDKGFALVRKAMKAKKSVRKDLMPKITALKSCKNKTFYNEHIKDKFNQCPWGESGICFKPAMNKAIDTHLTGEPHKVWLKYNE